MARNASGTYSLPSGNPVVTQTAISSTWANTTLNDIATEITDSLSRSGEGGMLVALQLADGTVGAPSLTFASELSSGLFRNGAQDVRLAVGGQARIIERSGSGNVALEFSSNQVAAEASDAFLFNTSVTRTAGNLLNVTNNASSRFRVQYNGTAVLGEGLASGTAVLFKGGAANGAITILGNRDVGDGGIDVDVGSTTTRVAGTLFRISNNASERIRVGYDGSFWIGAGLSSGSATVVTAAATDGGLIVRGNRAAGSGTADIQLETVATRVAGNILVINNNTVPKAKVDFSGFMYSDKFSAFSAGSATLMGTVADGASAVGTILDNSIDLLNAAAKLASFRRAGAEKVSIRQDGQLFVPAITNNTSTYLAMRGAATDGAAAIGNRIGNSNALSNATAKILSFYNDSWVTEKSAVRADGALLSDLHQAFTATSATVLGAMADGASAIGVILDNTIDLTNAGAKLVSFRRAGVEKAYLDKDGNLSTAASQTWTSLFATADQTLGASADTDMTSLTFAMVAGTYAIRGVILCFCTSATSALDITMKATGAPTTSRIGIGGFKDNAAASMQSDQGNATSDTSLAAANFASGNMDANLEQYRTFAGSVVATGSGTFQLRAHVGGTLVTLRAGSHLEYRKIA